MTITCVACIRFTFLRFFLAFWCRFWANEAEYNFNNRVRAQYTKCTSNRELEFRSSWWRCRGCSILAARTSPSANHRSAQPVPPGVGWPHPERRQPLDRVQLTLDPLRRSQHNTSASATIHDIIVTGTSQRQQNRQSHRERLKTTQLQKQKGPRLREWGPAIRGRAGGSVLSPTDPTNGLPTKGSFFIFRPLKFLRKNQVVVSFWWYW